VAVSSPVILRTISSFVAHEGKKRGYSKDATQPVRARVLSVAPIPLGQRTVNALEEVTTDYMHALSIATPSEADEAKPANLFSSAICEAIVFRFLEDSGRTSDALTEDAHVYFGEVDRPHPKNIDFIWALPDKKRAEAYECKTDPGWLLRRYYTREAPGNLAEWRKEKLFLMLELHRLLQAESWYIHLGCVTLLSRHLVEVKLEAYGSGPPELDIYCREDLGDGFPPAMPN